MRIRQINHARNGEWYNGLPADKRPAWESYFYLDEVLGVLRWKCSTGPRANVGDIAGSIGDHGYINLRVNNEHYYAHNIIFEMYYHRRIKPGYEIDHINGIRWDNRPENLREVTKSRNQRNKCLRRDNTSGISGVARNNNGWNIEICDKYYGWYSDFDYAAMQADILKAELGITTNQAHTEPIPRNRAEWLASIRRLANSHSINGNKHFISEQF